MFKRKGDSILGKSYQDTQFYFHLYRIVYCNQKEQTMEDINWKFNSEGIVHSSVLLELSYRLQNEHTFN